MSVGQIIARAWRQQHGANVAQAAGVALLTLALLGAILFNAPKLSAIVDTDFQCLLSALGGGGGGCNSAAAPAAEEEDDDDCGWGFLCHVGGVAVGFGEGLVDTVTGLGTLAWDGVLILSGDQATIDKYRDLARAFIEDPLGTTVALGEAIIAPIVTDWQNGNYGEAIGRGIFEGLSIVVGPKGANNISRAGRLDDLATVGNRADDLADAGNRADDIVTGAPCLLSLGKTPGLAKPLEGCSPSAILGGNLENAGMARPANSAAHHMVAASSPKAAQARRVLQRYGIDINDPGNGVWLPDTPTSTAPGMYHRTLHTNRYYDEINRRLNTVRSRDEALEVLEQVREELINGTFPR